MENYTIKTKRIYEEADAADGYRILIDRLWPRGISKERAALNEWDKEIAPSTELRIEFGHMESRFAWFSKLYKQELAAKTADLKRIKEISQTQNVTLLYGSKNEKVNHAVVLLEVLEEM